MDAITMDVYRIPIAARHTPSIRSHAGRLGQASVKVLMLAVLFLLASTRLAQTAPARNGTTESTIIDIREALMSMKASTASPEDHSGIDYAQFLARIGALGAVQHTGVPPEVAGSRRAAGVRGGPTADPAWLPEAGAVGAEM
ncbi:hypothetical protein MTO96_019770 [Rhipicephalus appendiculatus]